MADCEEVKQQLLLELRRDALAHERGDYTAIGAGYKNFCSLPDFVACEAGDDNASHRLTIAENFWGSWQDARNHNWGYYPGIERDDWPKIARLLCDGIENGLSPEVLHEQVHMYDAPSRLPFWNEWWNRWKQKRSP